MSRRVRIRKAILWALALILAIGAGGAIAAYNYVTRGDTLVELIRREAPRYLPRSRVDLISARIWPLRGEVLFHDISVGERGAAGPASLAYLPYVQVNFDPWAMLHGRFEAREVVIPRPTIRLRRRPDGTWNCQGLLADPWPGPAGGTTLPVRIKDGTVELIDEGAEEGAVLKVLTDVAIDVPAVEVGAPLPFELSAKGDLFERVTLRGAVDPAGRVAFDKGELVRLNLSDTLWKRLPPEVSAKLDQLGLSAGEVDANWSALEIRPGDSHPVRCDGSIRLRRGIWNCPKLPFPINDVSVDVEVRDGQVYVTSAKGVDGTTALSIRGKFGLDCSAQDPFEVAADITGLQLDNRLRAKTPGDLLDLWDLYFPEVAPVEEGERGADQRVNPGGPGRAGGRGGPGRGRRPRRRGDAVQALPLPRRARPGADAHDAEAADAGQRADDGGQQAAAGRRRRRQPRQGRHRAAPLRRRGPAGRRPPVPPGPAARRPQGGQRLQADRHRPRRGRPRPRARPFRPARPDGQGPVRRAGEPQPRLLGHLEGHPVPRPRPDRPARNPPRPLDLPPDVRAERPGGDRGRRQGRAGPARRAQGSRSTSRPATSSSATTSARPCPGPGS